MAYGTIGMYLPNSVFVFDVYVVEAYASFPEGASDHTLAK
jgi:hypothetical protein